MKRYIIYILCAFLLCACEKENSEIEQARENNLPTTASHNFALNQIESLSAIIGFNIQDFATSDPFNQYINDLENLIIIWNDCSDEYFANFYMEAMDALLINSPFLSDLDIDTKNMVIDTSIS